MTPKERRLAEGLWKLLERMSRGKRWKGHRKGPSTEVYGDPPLKRPHLPQKEEVIPNG